MVKFFNNEQKKHPNKTSEYFDLPEQLFYLWK